jgi:hypothetical protein
MVVVGGSMDKIIVRKKILDAAHRNVGSSLILLSNAKYYKSPERLIEDYGIREVMLKLYDEVIDNDEIEKSTLYQQYYNITQMVKDNDKCYRENAEFIELYKLNDEFALQVDLNIHLYHLAPRNEFYARLCPWYYADSIKYIGDCWGENDEDIIQSIQNLSYIDFVKRYKGY